MQIRVLSIVMTRFVIGWELVSIAAYNHPELEVRKHAEQGVISQTNPEIGDTLVVICEL